MSKAIEVKTNDFVEIVMNSDKPTIVDFWAPWCGYCVRMMPIFEKLSEELGDKVNFVKVNTDEESALAGQFKIEILPTFAIIKNREVVDRKIGYVPEEDLRAAIEAVL